MTSNTTTANRASNRTNFHHLLAQAAAAHPDAPALTYRDTTVSYAQTWRMARAAAAQLLAIGLTRGDRVAIYLEKRIETVASFFAVSAAGGVFVPINHVLKATQVGHILGDSGAEVLITSADRLPQLALVLPGTLVAHVIVVGVRRAGSCRILADPQLGRRPGEPDRPGPAASDRHRSGGDPVHLGQHRQAEGRRAQPPQPDRRRREREQLPGEHRQRRHPQRPSAELRRRPQPGDDGLLCRRPLRPDELPASEGRAETVRAVRRHRTHLRAPAVAAVGRRALAGSDGASSAVLGEHRGQDAARHPRTGCGASSRRPTPTSCTGSPRHSARPIWTRRKSTDVRIRSAKPSPMPRSSCSARTAQPAGPARRANLCTAAHSWRSATGTTRCAPQNTFVPCATPDRSGARPKTRSGRGTPWWPTTEGFLYFVGRKDEMIKTSGYRVSPSEIEEAAYNTGLVRDAVALGVDDEALGQRIVLVATADGRRTRRRRAHRRAEADPAALHGPLPHRRARRTAPFAERKVRSHAPHAGGVHVTPQEHIAVFGTTAVN